ncbi:MAG: hypothetical protein ABIS12_17995 [Bacteroidia bacterium]
MSKTDFKTWYDSEENPSRRSQTIGENTYRLVHIPKSLLALREAGVNSNDSVIKATEEHYSELEYFQLEIGGNQNGELLKQNLTDVAEYNRRVTYCAFDMQQDIHLVTDGQDSIPCALFHFERAYDVAPVGNFMIAFDKKRIATAKKITLVFTDNLFKNGIVKFSYLKEELLASPQMK